jgi:hypothetical protein
MYLQSLCKQLTTRDLTLPSRALSRIKDQVWTEIGATFMCLTV